MTGGKGLQREVFIEEKFIFEVKNCIITVRAYTSETKSKPITKHTHTGKINLKIDMYETMDT